MHWHQFPEDLEAALPLASEVSEQFAFLQVASSDWLVDHRLVVSDDGVAAGCSLKGRGLDSFDAADLLEALLAFDPVALVAFAEDNELAFAENAADLSNGQDVEVPEFVVDHTAGTQLASHPFNGFSLLLPDFGLILTDSVQIVAVHWNREVLISV